LTGVVSPDLFELEFMALAEGRIEKTRNERALYDTAQPDYMETVNLLFSTHLHLLVGSS
jgi:hypothetical protein